MLTVISTGVIRTLLKIAVLPVFLISINRTTTLEATLRTGLRTLSRPTVSMELESILFQKFQKISGVSTDKHLECSRWVRTLTVTQLTLVHIKKT